MLLTANEVFWDAVAKEKARLKKKGPLKEYTVTCTVRWLCPVSAPSIEAAREFVEKHIEEKHFLKLDEPDDWDNPIIEEGAGVLDTRVDVDESGKPVGNGYAGIDAIANRAVEEWKKTKQGRRQAQ